MIKICRLSDMSPEEILDRSGQRTGVAETVSAILADVRSRGDEALREYTSRFDGVDLSSFAVTREEIETAWRNTDREFLDVLEEAAGNIRAYHREQLTEGYTITRENGVILGQKVTPISKVGIYVPGGTAAYPSTVLMNAIPAKIAGCRQIVMVTPPDTEGNVPDAILAAAKIAGVDQIYKVGGAQAVAALAYGTRTIPAVDKIVGPGNAYVAEGKRQVFGKVAVDMIAGPSEILILADDSAKAEFVAADLLSQAEHDRMATAVLVTTSETLANQVCQALQTQLAQLPREAIARESICRNGKIILVDDLKQGVAISNQLAPEHLELCVEDPFAYLDGIDNAGSVFMGHYCPEPLGDYFAGPNHTLPTSGTARFSSALSVDDFIKKQQFTYYTQDALAEDAGKVALFARKEGLTAHARSVEIRFE